MQRYAPPGVQAHVTRLRMTGTHHVPIEELLPRIVEASLALADARCDPIVFHCTASSMEAGIDGEARVLEAMRTATGSQVATTATGTLAAMRALGLRRIAVLSPYVAATHQHEIEFLEEAGLSIIGGRCLGLSGSDEYLAVTPEDWLHIVQTETPEEAQGVFLSCTNIHTPEVVEPLELVLHRPVVTSNQATLWYALRLLGLDEKVIGLGRLFNIGTEAAV